MKNLFAAIVCVMLSVSIAFAQTPTKAEMKGKMQEAKSEMKAAKTEMKGKMQDAKGDMKAAKEEMKAAKADMKGKVQEAKADMKATKEEMKAAKAERKAARTANAEAGQVIGKTKNGMTVMVGPKGGKYYLNEKGVKVYVKDADIVK